MIDIPKSLIKAIQQGTESPHTLKQYISKYPIDDILTAFTELILLSEDYISQTPISISKEEYDRIMSLFRIKGQKVLDDGTIVEERRGRKKGN